MTERNAFISLLRKLELLTDNFDAVSALTAPRLTLATLNATGALSTSEDVALQKIAESLKLQVLTLRDPDFLASCNIDELATRCGKLRCLTKQCIPLKETQRGFLIAFSNPMDVETIQSLEFALNGKVEVVLAPAAAIERLLQRHCSSTQIDLSKTVAGLPDHDIQILSKGESEYDTENARGTAAPVIKLVNKILADAVDECASDVHFEPGEEGLDVRFRVDGVMIPTVHIPLQLCAHVLSRVKLLAAMNIAERRKPQDGRFRAQIDGTAIDFRASSIPTAYGEKIVLRLLHESLKEMSFEDLGMPVKMADSLRDQLKRRSRLVLVTGPTGSGKTTTLYTSLHFVNDGKNNIETVEDPIEYRVAGISQVQVNEAVNVTFASALRSILRQDPDVIMIGEIRDQATAEIAVRAAQTGHQVLSTLHTNSAPEALTRLHDLEVDSFVLSSSLGCVIAQRLIRKLCRCCSTPASQEMLQRWKETIEQYDLPREVIAEAHGCEACKNTGYKGRTAIYSYLEVTTTIAKMIQRNAPLEEIVEEARHSGFHTLEDEAITLVRNGLTTIEEIHPHLEKKEEKRTVTIATKEVTPLGKAHGNITVGRGSSVERPLVLLVDDDENIRELYQSMLETNFYEVMTADNGRDGLEKLYSRVPDLVLLDYMMPKMDGKAFVQQLKSDQRTRSIPILMFTAAPSEDREVELLAMGVDDFVSKTSSAKVLLARVKSALAKNQSA